MRAAKDFREGVAQSVDTLRMPTIRIPCDCECTWTVVKAGPGEQAISQQNRANALCPRLRQHEQLREKQRQAAEKARLQAVAP